MPYPQYGVSLPTHWVRELHANTIYIYNTLKLPLSRHIGNEGCPYLRTVHSLETWLILVQVLYRQHCTCMWRIILTCLDQYQDKAVERMTLLSSGTEFPALVLPLTAAGKTNSNKMSHAIKPNFGLHRMDRFFAYTRNLLDATLSVIFLRSFYIWEMLT